MRQMLSRLPKSTLVLIAFASVYLCWGSTYLAIHVAGEQLPVPVVSGMRSLLIRDADCADLPSQRRKSLRVDRDEVWKLVLVGLLFMSGNNMLLTWGEKMVPSGFASLVISTIPIMIALLETFLPGLGGHSGDALNKRGWAGTLLGTAGIVVLVWPSLHAGHAMVGYSRPLLGTLVLLGAALSFAVGSVLSRRFRFRADTFVATGWQIGAAGIFNLAWRRLPAACIARCGRLLALPADAFFGVFEEDAFFEQLVADGVGAGEVALLLGLGALGDEGVDVGVGEGSVPKASRGPRGDVGHAAFGLGPGERGAGELGVAVFEDGEDGVELVEQGERFFGVGAGEARLIGGGVDGAQDVEDGGAGFGGVEVVVERGGEVEVAFAMRLESASSAGRDVSGPGHLRMRIA
jgi:drug/metabolite transporter (DMT)-like permease